MKQQQAIEAKEPNKRRGGDWIEQRFPKIEAVRSAVGCPSDANERKATRRFDAQPPALLEENSLGTALVEPLEAFQVAALEGQIAVECGAERGRYVGRFISLDDATEVWTGSRNFVG